MKTEFDGVVFYTTMLLVFVGIVMVFSASFIQSSFKHNDAYYFLKECNICCTWIYSYDYYIKNRL